MLKLLNITKDYLVAGEKVGALKGVTLNFRRSEFVSILGPSGCGKTTLLNIIGGLDKYTSGDLVIEGRSTKQYSDRDWDTYRNHSIGFIFQSYHLIPHQTILQNVELALTIAGVSKEERRQRAIDALDKVGLRDKMKNRPNQLSGGQAQRVAIARALINDPEIVLADEPTGALDSVTSVQIMELLKEISRDRLVIMVTHNPELAEEYSTRIVRLKDGLITGDTMPYSAEDEAEEVKKLAEEGAAETVSAAANGQTAEETPALETAQEATAEEKPQEASGGRKRVNKGTKKQSSMSIGMAMALSIKNLLSKRKRTAMVAVAGSIGIIGVSMVLAISAGVQGYIRSMENDMLSGNPVAITQSTYDFTTLVALNGDKVAKEQIEQLKKDKKVGVTSLLKTLGTFSTGFEKTNQFTDEYKAYLSEMPAEDVNVVQYKYAFNIVNNIYTDFTVSANLANHFKPEDYSESFKNNYDMSVTAIRSMYSSVLSEVEGYKEWGSMISSVETFAEVPDNYKYILSQYDVLAVDRDGEIVTENFTDAELKDLFTSKETLVMVLKDYSSQDLTLAQYGYFTEDEFLDYALKGVGNSIDTALIGDGGIPFARFIGKDSKKFTYYPNDYVYTQTETVKDTMPDAMVRFMFMNMFGSSQEAQFMGVMLASQIIDARNQGNDVLKEYLSDVNGYNLSSMYETLKVYDEPEVTKSYVANAYSSAYTYTSTSGVVELDGFDTRAQTVSEEMKPVNLGVKLILQKKADVSYGCLEAGFYYTNALTKYVLDIEKNSEIVKFVNGGAEMSSVPMYLDYYYVDPELDNVETNEVNGVKYKYYKLGTAQGAIESQTNLMSSLIDSVISGMGTAQQKTLTAGIFGGDETPIAVSIYPVDFETKDNVTAYLDKWNDVCTAPVTASLPFGYEIKVSEKVKYAGTFDIKEKDDFKYIEGVTVSGRTVKFADGTKVCAGVVTLPDGTSFKITDSQLPAGVNRSGDEITLPNGAKVSGGSVSFTINYTSAVTGEATSGTVTLSTPILSLKDGTLVLGLEEANKITYTDTVGLIIDMINTMIKMITIALVAFTALSLVVSTVMIGIITYVSVVERVKEIGILRAVGARKKDIKRLFNAETFIIGLIAGLFGILVTYLLSLVINVIVYALAGFWGIAALPWWQAVIMVALSISLTLVSGLIPASAAAKKDPVVALRTE